MTTVIPHIIKGQEVSESASFSPVFNPATGEETAQLAVADSATVADAVAKAQEALPAWRSTGLAKRADVFFKLREIITSRQSELAEIISLEHGKVPSDAAGEIARGLENVEFCAGLLHHMKGEYLEQAATGINVHQVRQPVGVVACITPFNFPAMVPLWMVTAAIAAGNTVILKPSERDPSAANWIVKAFHEAGLPEGVLNLVHGGKDTVEALIEAPQVKAVSFVGSTPIAKSIYERATALGKRCQALGGAKNHMVVMPDADLDAAADAAISAGFGSAGERCMAVSVVVPVGDIADELVAKIRERIADIKVGPGTDPQAEMGPVITAQAKERIEGFIAGAEESGASVLVDGRKADLPTSGYFIGPTLVDDVVPGMPVYDEEIFGPVLAVARVDTFDAAVELINSNRYANGTAVFTRDGRTAREFEFNIEVGMVGINVPIPVPIGAFSFGGWKDSLFGDTHIYGPEAFNFYTRRKVVTERWPLPSESQVNLGFPTH
ncbi:MULTISPECIES: CoA-acylating methylmalonate-semialdehyde dehydrogenase [Corynebacterium]|uniref:methylmalonate-semialdehyde dehydrogenase (CoA acylating) n=1 Tax=Corynebacterium flavescens TaxID=28028 RepID=A0AB73B9T6_CORFL|nr:MULTISPECIES: CoA-acylating methylmalonate-semialdehyde dehydrogenase [Corynebacterium]MDN6100166.1 CoA-acylating methylmalonate-semialdehyde dehydrogenase [Corynebacterium flavescens]MDN6199748.1 CoA-acylating methylmalonate-semialdehyde dehydrogenase [Corynebacterium flavescens]MDN6226791.1 CoA-acylating methylmalonate-semialdehyde dehydrogenase [Corynebacterium flavescens]MDN6236033.1 CoA-acylating methylmalonate-semialdehyde dehydrogenase [Corynebacterium flavescens]MDN6431917.1 CoA-acy